MNRFLLTVIVVAYVGSFAKLSKAHDWYSDKKTSLLSCCSGVADTADSVGQCMDANCAPSGATADVAPLAIVS